MRIDRFLFFIRLVKSRTLAQGLIEEGHVRIDGKRVEKSTEEVRVGQRHRSCPCTVMCVCFACWPSVRRGPAAEARACYEELGIDEPKPAT